MVRRSALALVVREVAPTLRVILLSGGWPGQAQGACRDADRKLFRMRGKGVKSVRGGNQGDLLCRVVVETPVGLNEKQKSLLRELEESFGAAAGEKNIPRSKSFLNGVKKFFADLTR